jgi:hypothetical protein
MALTDPRSATALIGRRVVDPADVPIGSCSAVFADEDTGVPQWLAVALPEMDRIVVVPLDAAVEAADDVKVAVGREAAASAPVPGSTDRLSTADQRLLSGHYHRPDMPSQTTASVRMRVGGSGLRSVDAMRAEASGAPPGAGWKSETSTSLWPPRRPRASSLGRLVTGVAVVAVVMAVRRRRGRRHMATKGRLLTRRRATPRQRRAVRRTATLAKGFRAARHMSV